MRRLRLCTLVPCLFELGCDSPTSSVAHAAEWTRPYVQEFARFDRWARRASASDAVLQSRDALGETTFAPIRRDPAVAAAWVQVEGERVFTIALPPAAELPASDWVALRDPGLGALRAARLEQCARVLSSAPPPPRDTPCVLISRREATPPNGVTTVTVAFREPAPARQGSAAAKRRRGATISSDQSKPK